MRFKAFIVVLVLLHGCSPQKRLNRIIDRNPDLVRNDTIRDTVIIPEVRLDTFLYLGEMLDTVYITQDRLSIKTIYKDNKVYIEGKCDTVEIIREIPVEKVVYVQDTIWTDIKKYSKWILGAFIFLLLYLFAKRLASAV